MDTDSIKELTKKSLNFRDERDWKQFHSAKNLASSLAVEAAELLDHYLWQDKPDDFEGVREEVGDVLITLLLFCYETGIDPGEALESKLSKTALNYPVDKAKGSSKKYRHL